MQIAATSAQPRQSRPRIPAQSPTARRAAEVIRTDRPLPHLEPFRCPRQHRLDLQASAVLRRRERRRQIDLSAVDQGCQGPSTDVRAELLQGLPDRGASADLSRRLRLGCGRRRRSSLTPPETQKARDHRVVVAGLSVRRVDYWIRFVAGRTRPVPLSVPSCGTPAGSTRSCAGLDDSCDPIVGRSRRARRDEGRRKVRSSPHGPSNGAKQR